jgi:hypothetical protein
VLRRSAVGWLADVAGVLDHVGKQASAPLAESARANTSWKLKLEAHPEERALPG